MIEIRNPLMVAGIFVFIVLSVSQLKQGDDPYKILGVKKTADRTEIKAAFRKLTMQLHPDLNKGKDTTEMWVRVNDAYELLNDPDRKNMWDTYGVIEGDTSPPASESILDEPPPRIIIPPPRENPGDNVYFMYYKYAIGVGVCWWAWKKVNGWLTEKKNEKKRIQKLEIDKEQEKNDRMAKLEKFKSDHLIKKRNTEKEKAEVDQDEWERYKNEGDGPEKRISRKKSPK